MAGIHWHKFTLFFLMLSTPSDFTWGLVQLWLNKSLHLWTALESGRMSGWIKDVQNEALWLLNPGFKSSQKLCLGNKRLWLGLKISFLVCEIVIALVGLTLAIWGKVVISVKRVKKNMCWLNSQNFTYRILFTETNFSYKNECPCTKNPHFWKNGDLIMRTFADFLVN